MIAIDSDAIIDFLRGKEEVVKLIRKYKDELVTTEINVMEVFAGVYLKKKFRKNEEADTESFFDSIEKFPFDKNCGKMSAEIIAKLSKKGLTINQNDCLISAILIKNRVNRIITQNKRHFDRIDGFKIVSY